MDPNAFYAPGPPMMSHPPRIFGNISADGSPIPATLTGPPIFSQDDLDDGHDQGDPKRRRIARVRRRGPGGNLLG
jgi:hypothetical protein